MTTNIKNNNIIIFPDKLYLNDLIDKDLINNVNITYNLYGIINHIGIIQQGHYFSYINLNNSSFYDLMI